MRSLRSSPASFNLWKAHTRPLLFERTDEDAFVSILCMVFFFSWDASIFDLTGRLLLQTSHDGWLDVRTNDKALAKDIAVELESYRVPLLAR